MPKAWTETQIRISDQLLDALSDAEQAILLELAIDSLNHPDAWVRVDGLFNGLFRCSFLGRDGLPVVVEIGIATVDSSSDATVYFIHLKEESLSDLSTPLTRIDEFATDYVDADYQSKPVSEQRVLKIRLGQVRRLRPMKHDAEE